MPLRSGAIPLSCELCDNLSFLGLAYLRVTLLLRISSYTCAMTDCALEQLFLILKDWVVGQFDGEFFERWLLKFTLEGFKVSGSTS